MSSHGWFLKTGYQAVKNPANLWLRFSAPVLQFLHTQLQLPFTGPVEGQNLLRLILGEQV